MNRRRKRRIPFAAYAALIFNGALCATPFMAAHLISQAYGDKRPVYQATPEAITATRQAMDERFQTIALKEDAAPRDVWSDLVRKALEEREMPRVRASLISMHMSTAWPVNSSPERRGRVACQASAPQW